MLGDTCHNASAYEAFDLIAPHVRGIAPDRRVATDSQSTYRHLGVNRIY